jgi:hypothetical protein
VGRSSGVRGGGSFSGDTERSSLSLVSVSLPLSSCRTRARAGFGGVDNKNGFGDDLCRGRRKGVESVEDKVRRHQGGGETGAFGAVMRYKRGVGDGVGDGVCVVIVSFAGWRVHR